MSLSHTHTPLRDDDVGEDDSKQLDGSRGEGGCRGQGGGHFLVLQTDGEGVILQSTSSNTAAMQLGQSGRKRVALGHTHTH